MKKLLFLLPLLIFSCKKDAPVNINPENTDSVLAIDQTSVPGANDSIATQDSLISNSAAVERVLDEGVNRSVDQNEIVRTAVGSMVPFTLGDQFTEENQKFILKISNVSKPNLKLTLETKEPMNIRINQIKNPDGSMDGPFGKTLNLDTSKKGEYWIILTKSQMAEGNTKGHFSLKVQ